MLPKTNRLKKKKDIDSVFKKGKATREELFNLRWALNGLKQSRFAVVISKKISKKAVTRNKIRRIIAGAIQEKLPEIKKNVDAVLLTFSGVEKKDAGEIKKTLDAIFKKTKITENLK